MKLSAREQQKLAELRDTVFEGQCDLFEALDADAQQHAGEEQITDALNTDTPYKHQFLNSVGEAG